MGRWDDMRPDVNTPLREMSENNIYYGMLHRCNNPDHHKYSCYGGRGIKVCERWLESFKNFYEDMGKRPSIKHTLDRIDNDGDYTPENCRWATKKEQSRNQRTNRKIEAFGKILCLAEWSEEFNIPVGTLESRLDRSGWCITKALLTRYVPMPQTGKRVSEEVRKKILKAKESNQSCYKVAEIYEVSKTTVLNIWKTSL